MDNDRLREIVGELPPGKRQFLANHMWKHYAVFPQKLKGFVPDWAMDTQEADIRERNANKPKLGDVVRVKKAMPEMNDLPEGLLSVLVRVDEYDRGLPYGVMLVRDTSGNTYNEVDFEWAPAEQLEVVK